MEYNYHTFIASTHFATLQSGNHGVHQMGALNTDEYGDPRKIMVHLAYLSIFNLRQPFFSSCKEFSLVDSCIRISTYPKESSISRTAYLQTEHQRPSAAHLAPGESGKEDRSMGRCQIA
jgi:hypothetical protein